MEFILQRYSDNRESTLGLLFKKIQIGTKAALSLQCYTLEDESRAEKVSGETRIPAGTYKLEINKAETPLTKKYQAKYPWFKNHIQVMNVPGFIGVYMHIGNSDEDTMGCILCGDSVDNNSISEGTISNSTIAFKRLYGPLYDHLLSKGTATLEIRDEDYLLRKP